MGWVSCRFKICHCRGPGASSTFGLSAIDLNDSPSLLSSQTPLIPDSCPSSTCFFMKYSIAQKKPGRLFEVFLLF